MQNKILQCVLIIEIFSVDSEVSHMDWLKSVVPIFLLVDFIF
jgi:uncharacterized membrane protein YjdF